MNSQDLELDDLIGMEATLHTAIAILQDTEESDQLVEAIS